MPILENWTRRPLVPATLAFLAGVAGGLAAPAAAFIAAGMAALAFACTRHRACLALLAVWALLGTGRGALWRSDPADRLLAMLPDEPAEVRVHGVIADDPAEPLTPSAQDPDEPRATQCTALLELRHVRAVSGWLPAAGRLRVVMDHACPAYGDEVVAEGLWRRVPAQGNWGVYDWRAALARDHVHGLLRVRSFDAFHRLRARQGPPLLQAAAEVRRRCDALATGAGPARAGLLRSFLLGRRAELEEPLRNAFIETGTMHLVVISGSHVGLIALLVEVLLRLLGVPWRGRLALAAVAVGAYWLVIGAQAPVSRAAWMAWAILGASALGRTVDWGAALAAATLAIVWTSPAQLLDPGFQLSAGAVASLIAFAPAWMRALTSRLAWVPGTARWWLAAGLSATAAVWVGLWPLLAWYFHLVAPAALIANLVLSPLVSGLVAAGTLALAAGTAWHAAWTAALPLVSMLVDAVTGSVMWCRRLLPGAWYVGQPPLPLVLGYYVVLLASCWGRQRGWRLQGLAAAWLILFNAGVWGTVAAAACERRWLTLQVLDVGHGDALLVRAPGGRTLLVDAGSRVAGRLRVVPVLRQAGITRLDALVLTHGDEDHSGGAAAVLEAVRVDRLLTNGAADGRAAPRRTLAAARRRRVACAALAAGASIDAGQWRMDVLHPPAGFVPGVSPGGNDNSLVLRLAYGDVSVLLTGDIDEPGLPSLLGQGGRLRSTVLKMPHHGSRLGSLGDRFFQLVHPSWALLSVGAIHYLPAPESIAAVLSTGAQLRSTRRDGAIRVRTDGRRIQIITKHQIPNTKQTPSTKFQTDGLVLGIWNLFGIWDLVIGAYRQVFA